MTTSKPVLLGRLPLFGWHTAPKDPTDLGLVVLNAGLLPAYGPYGLHLELAAWAAQQGVSSLLLDQSGKGESPARSDCTRVQAVGADFAEAVRFFADRGVTRIIVAGLCSGADDTLTLADNEAMVGALLLDPFCRKTWRFRAQWLLPRLRPMRAAKVLQRIGSRATMGTQPAQPRRDVWNVRDWPPLDTMEQQVRQLITRECPVLAVFTGSVSNYYAYEGQFGAAFTHRKLVEEHYLPKAEHIYPTTADRQALGRFFTLWLQKHF